MDAERWEQLVARLEATRPDAYTISPLPARRTKARSVPCYWTAIARS